MRREEGGKGWQIEAVRALGLVLLAALVVRLYLFLYTPVIAGDAVVYITQAQLMAQGAWPQASAADFEPVFPFSIFIFHSILPDWELAGKLASLTFGVLAVVPFFLISRDVFGPRVAFGAGILFALHPYLARNSAEALQESTYLFFFLMSVWLALKALNSSGMRWYLLCAVAILATRLTRTEGIWLFLAVLLFYGFRSLGDLRRREWTGPGPLVRFSLAFVMIMLPIFVYGTQVVGTSELSSYKGLGGLKTVLHQIPVAFQGYFGRINGLGSLGQPLADLWKDFIYKFVQTFHPVLLFLAVPAFLKQEWRFQYRDHLLLTSSVALVYLSGPFLLWFGGTALSSHRFFLAPVAVALPWAAVTIEMAATRMKRSNWSEDRLARKKKWSVLGHRSPATDNQWGTIILVVVALILAAKTVKPQRLDKLPIKEAGAWIAAQELKVPVIMAHDSRIAFYAKGRILHMTDTLEKKTWQEQNQIVQNVVRQARSQEVKFVFLKGSLDRKANRIILASTALDRIKEWRSPYGNAYTLIQLK